MYYRTHSGFGFSICHNLFFLHNWFQPVGTATVQFNTTRTKLWYAPTGWNCYSASATPVNPSPCIQGFWDPKKHLLFIMRSSSHWKNMGKKKPTRNLRNLSVQSFTTQTFSVRENRLYHRTNQKMSNHCIKNQPVGSPNKRNNCRDLKRVNRCDITCYRWPFAGKH